MANEDAKKGIQTLAARVQGRPTTLTEAARLERALEAKPPATREAVKSILAEVLSKNLADVNRILATADNSDRLIDEIVRALSK